MNRWHVIILATVVSMIAGSAGAQMASSTQPRTTKKAAQPVAVATPRPAAVDPAKPIDPTVGVGGLRFKRQDFDTGLKSGTRYQTDLTPRKDLYLYGGATTPDERRPGGVPTAPVDQTRPAGTTFGGGVGVRF